MEPRTGLRRRQPFAERGKRTDAALRRALRFGTARHGSGDPEAVAATRTRIAQLAEGTEAA